MLVQDETTFLVPMSEIHEDVDFNCRSKVTPFDVLKLAESIRERGLQQPITIREYSLERQLATGHKYGLVAGYRRFAACKHLKRETIRATVKRDISDTEARIINLEENVQREDLNILEEARALEKLKIAGLTQQEVAKKLNKSSGWVQIRFHVLEFPEDIQKDIEKGNINQSQIQGIYALPRSRWEEAVENIKKKRSRGEKGITISKPTYLNSKRAKNKSEMNRLKDHIYHYLGPSFTTRVLAYCTGDISWGELATSLKRECEEAGKWYIIPDEEP